MKTSNMAEAFFEDFFDQVYAYAYRRTNSATVAEDVAAETFLEAAGNRLKLRHSDPLPWLFGIARRKIADYYRKAHIRREVPLAPDLLANGHVHIGLERDSAAQKMRFLIEALEHAQKEVVLLCYVEDLSAAQAAKSMGRSVAAVNSLLQRARQNLRESGKSYFCEDLEDIYERRTS